MPDDNQQDVPLDGKTDEQSTHDDADVTGDRTRDAALKAAKLADEAGKAYLDGEAEKASQLYKEAGDSMAGVVADAPKPRDRDFVRILAAANYYKGGHFQLALRLCERVKPARIKQELRVVHARFCTELRERTRTDYRQRVAARINKLSTARKYEECLLVLNEHPWALPAQEVMRLRFTFGHLAGLLEVSEIMGTDVAVPLVATSDEQEALQGAADTDVPPS